MESCTKFLNDISIAILKKTNLQYDSKINKHKNRMCK